jgi:diketogulonate reductase-like aldo/keto reductase
VYTAVLGVHVRQFSLLDRIGPLLADHGSYERTGTTFQARGRSAIRRGQQSAPPGMMITRATPTLLVCLAAAALAAAAAPPADRAVSLGGGVEMPVIALGTGGMSNDTAAASVKLALANGLNHIHTAFDYFNQVGVGDGLAGKERSSFFLTTMTSPCIHTASNPIRNVTDPSACHTLTKNEVMMDLSNLKLDYVDLLLLHGPAQAYGTQGVCQPDICEITRAQWAAYVELQKAGKARAIGVSNFCQSCFECLASGPNTTWPAVNQVQYHVGMGTDPEGLLSYSKARGIVVQAYSPLAGGKIFDPAPAPLTGAKGWSGSGRVRGGPDQGGRFYRSVAHCIQL